MPLKAKLFLLTLIPLLCVTASISWIFVHQTKSLGQKEIETFRAKLLESRERALQDNLQLAMAAINHVYARSSTDDQSAKRQVKQILTNLRYGQDGYFFVYDKNGVNLVHPTQPELIGTNLINLQDNNGNFLIQALLFEAQTGGGFHQYLWQQPSTGKMEEKLSYAAWLEKWEWMLGTGLYIDDIEKQVQQLTTTINKNIETTFFSVGALLGVTVAVIIVLTLAINFHEHKLADKSLRELVNRTVLFQEDEKKHLARELHDGINQLLVSSKCHLDILSHTVQQKMGVDSKTLTLIHKAEASLQTAILEVRRISHNLRPSVLDDLGLEAALNSLLDDFSEHAQLPIYRDIQLGKVSIDNEISTTLYRVVQESLTNIEKHAYASNVDIRLQRLKDTIQLIVRDDGVGFQSSDLIKKKGIGLRNMRERVEFIGGDFDMNSERGIGTEITVLLELKIQSAKILQHG
ncbi:MULTISPECIES: cache domain-containing protein [Vibrio]|uniref:Histidine kinase n=1 Tax=Vibrio casei TaxID=673372 RepID=A0A368LND3_9VIBR|nr:MULTISPECIES: cache domain-containing protein [Vibrio]RCS73311.1 histidine kinase [Vibrio casei]SJN18004.1 Sensor histidine kinase [Vibrio casei]HBV75782.1 histidine kinase [Vibrio sp.]